MKDITKSKYLETILVISMGLLLVYYFTRKDYWMYLGIGIGLIGLISPTIGRLITFGWYKLAAGLGYLNSRILLSLLFFLFLLPLAFLSRLFQKKKDPLQLKKRANGSYFVTRSKQFKADDLDKLW